MDYIIQIDFKGINKDKQIWINKHAFLWILVVTHSIQTKSVLWFRNDSCCSFSILKLIAKRKEKIRATHLRATTIAIAIVGRAITIERKIKERNYTKNEAKKIKAIRSNRAFLRVLVVLP